MEAKTNSVDIQAEVTPNPNTLKFRVNRVFFESGSMDFPDKEKAKDSYLASELFKINDVIGVFVGTNFVTATKNPAASWDAIVPGLVEKLKTVLASDQVLFSKQAPVSNTADTEIERKIKEILDSEIRPAVAMDGGDIVFYGYKDGVVTLHLQGSCSSCPSSIMTLKMGVENRLRASIPEVKEVVQV